VIERHGDGDARRDHVAAADDAERVRVVAGRRLRRAVRLRQVAGHRPLRGRHRRRDRRQRDGVRDRGDARAYADGDQLLHREPGVQRRADGDALHPDDVRLKRPARQLLALRLDAVSGRLLLTGDDRGDDDDDDDTTTTITYNNKKLSYHRGTAQRSMLASRAMGVIKVSNSRSDLQGHSRTLAMVSFDRPHKLPISLLLQLCLHFQSCTFLRYYHLIHKNLKRSRDSEVRVICMHSYSSVSIITRNLKCLASLITKL